MQQQKSKRQRSTNHKANTVGRVQDITRMQAQRKPR